MIRNECHCLRYVRVIRKRHNCDEPIVFTSTYTTLCGGCSNGNGAELANIVRKTFGSLPHTPGKFREQCTKPYVPLYYMYMYHHPRNFLDINFHSSILSNAQMPILHTNSIVSTFANHPVCICHCENLR